jgi:hypothetical protein
MRFPAGRALVHAAAVGLLCGGLLACAGEQPDQKAMLGERWCYRTLAEPDCSLTPEPENEARRVGWFDAASLD